MKYLTLFLLCAMALAIPEAALAGGISEFVSAPQKVMETITGPLGKVVAVIAMALCGVFFIMNKDDLTGGVKLLLTVVFGISFIPFAGDIVNALFGFSGALI